MISSVALKKLFIALMMEAESISETSVNFYETTRRNYPEDSDLHIHRRENLKSYLFLFASTYLYETAFSSYAATKTEYRKGPMRNTARGYSFLKLQIYLTTTPSWPARRSTRSSR
jgi:hypothetical protein